ncbi:MAG: DUF58 domain-containing protein [Desulfurococcales archaeon ex4484_58]|nr:MAG: DUF58 domain-containing protein [Desulfurococcales archaeon ex4484_58]
MVSRICSKAVLASKIARAHFSSLMYGVIPSKIKGPGFEYVDLREYSPGDDIRFIDWRASARMLKPDGDYRLMVKEHLLERLVNNIFVLDYSESMDYGDKIETAIYVLSGLLSIAHSVGDVIDLLILHGEKIYIKQGMDPIDAINFALNTICKTDPRGRIDLMKLSGYIKNFRNRESLFLVTDYAHYPVEFEVLASTVHSLNMIMGVVLVTTPIEVKPPGIGGYHLFIDAETPSKSIDLDIHTYYKLVNSYMNRVEAMLMKLNIDYVSVNGLDEAKYKKIRFVKLYSLTRIRRRLYPS